MITLTLKIFTHAEGQTEELVCSLSEWKLSNASENEKLFGKAVNFALKGMELLLAKAATSGTVVESEDITKATQAAFDREIKHLL